MISKYLKILTGLNTSHPVDFMEVILELQINVEYSCLQRE